MDMQVTCGAEHAWKIHITVDKMAKMHTYSQKNKTHTLNCKKYKNNTN